MIGIVCLDDKGGMALNHRRLSRDKKQREHLSRMLEDKSLGVAAYTEKLLQKDAELWRFEKGEEKIPMVMTVEKLSAAETDAVWFELEAPGLCGEGPEELWVYRWNRLYPSQVRMDLAKLEEAYNNTFSCEFAGSSHDRITFMVYRRKT